MSPYPQTLEWIGDAEKGCLRLIDQTQLPDVLTHLDCSDVAAVWDAIKRLRVRGAPAIGVAAAYGCVLGARSGNLKESIEYLSTSRPTAVNLFWALERMKNLESEDPHRLLTEARAIHVEDAAMCKAIGENALPLISAGSIVMTHCNAGALATGGMGTATAPIYLAHERGISFRVYANETRPLLQGARLTAWELSSAGIDVTLICDGMAAHVMLDQKISLVITGADRIAANGDVANKIGTYGLAVLARHHGIPFYVAAPSTTFDLSLPSGEKIPIEQRDPDEISRGFGRQTAPKNVRIYNPAFDVTPHELITGIITERGIIQPVNEQSVRWSQNT
ncbi:MAG: S-methyl-5-thioribose-1-phosphate isomerase [Deltaproteobacteria bacterium]|nr:S-methyl-5-thioribose-1-phosphate isomerase [Deltaproteobacteria bacterium]